MKKITTILVLFVAIATSIFAQSIVYYTKDVSSEGLLKVYNALKQEQKGKVGIKVSFGGKGENVLDAKLLTGLVAQTNATLFDANGLSGSRWTAAHNLPLAKENGFGIFENLLMLSDENYIDMPVNKGHLLTYARSGAEIDEFDTLIAVHKVRLHFLPAYDGNIKNISLCLANRSGKCLIHSGGKSDSRYQDTKPDVLAKSFADAAKAAIDYKKNWAFINVMDDFSCEDSCIGTPHQKKIGIIASTDLVAVEQCAIDMVMDCFDVSDATKEKWKVEHQVNAIEYAVQLGVGSRKYKLVEVK